MRTTTCSDQTIPTPVIPVLFFRLRRLLLRDGTALKDTHDVGLLHDEQFLAIDLHFCSRPLAEQNKVTRRHFRNDALPIVVKSARADREDLAFLRLLLHRVSYND